MRELKLLSRVFAVALVIVATSGSTAAQDRYSELGNLPTRSFSEPFQGAPTQTWAAIADEHGVLYFGNRRGILEYDGVRWRDIVTPEGRVVFSLARDDDGRILVGGDDLIGMIEPDSLGRPRFVEIEALASPATGELGELRNTARGNGHVYFQSRQVLLRFDGTDWDVQRAPAERPFLDLFEVDDVPYLLQQGRGLLKIETHRLVPIKLPDSAPDDLIRTVLPHQSGLIIGFRHAGLFLFDGHSLEHFAPESTEYLARHELSTGRSLSNGMLMIGTLAGGAVLLGEAGSIVSILQPESGLMDQTVHYLYEDVHGGVWLAMDRGISRVGVPPGRSDFRETRGLEGAVESITRHNGVLYASGMRGVFRLGKNAPPHFQAGFEQLAGMSGSCFELLSTEHGLLVGCGDGIYDISTGTPRRLVGGMAAITLLRLKSDPSIVLAGLTDGIAVLGLSSGRWVYTGRLEGFDGFVRHTVEDDSGDVWITTRLSGMQRLRPDGDDLRNTSIETLDSSNGLPEGRLRAFLVDGSLLVRGDDGVYRRAGHDHFTKDDRFESVLDADAGYPIRLESPEGGDIWVSLRSGPGRISRNDGIWTWHTVAAEQHGLTYAIHLDGDGTAWLGGAYGVYRVDRSDARMPEGGPPVLIRRITGMRDDAVLFGGTGRAQLPRLAPGFGTLRIAYGSTWAVTGQEIQYQTRLRESERAWSSWSGETYRDFSDLRGGSYTLLVRARAMDGTIGPETTLSFTVLPQWYETWWSRLLGLCLIAGVVVVGVRLRTRRLLRRTLELERTVSERTAELASRSRELEASNALLRTQKVRIEQQASVLAELDEMKSRFFANISHEFRTPLTLILGPTEDVLAEAHGPVSGRVRRQLQMAVRNGHRLQRLVNQLLDLSRAEAGSLQLSPQPVNFNRFVARLTRAFAPMAERQHVTLDVSTPDTEVVALIDPDQVEKILANLLSNAFKATDDGGRISVSLQYDDSEIVVAVEDDGIGIDPKHLPHIFDRFRQAHAGGWNAQPGSGIGLNLARELAALHGGTISVESVLAEGSCFTLRIPLLSADGVETAGDAPATLQVSEEAGTPGDHQTNDEEGDRTTVLVVDDEPDIRALVFDRLASTYRVVTAEDGELGLQAAKDHLPDVIVSDVMMPHMDGYTLCDAIKRDAELGHIPVILLTSKAGKGSRLEGLDTGADDYLTKPFDADELRARIRNLIALRRGLRERFEKEITVRPTNVKVNSAEAAFIEAVTADVDSNLVNPAYSVDALAEAVNLSVSQLQRKLRATLDETPVQLIRRMRLERAASLLEQRAGTVAEVAYASGFNSQAYFARAFKEHFGKTPSQVRSSESEVTSDG